ncbi:MAG: Fe2+-dependent dioxygenase [Panacagrimonas sp.]
MNLALSQIFTAEQLAGLQQQVSQLKFVDGASTAGWHAKLVKKNLQADAKDELTQKLTAGIREALLKHPLVQTALLPRRIRMPLISRYEPGMEYGAHVDNALMGGSEAVRTDIAITVFLTEPSSCDGGELVIESASGLQKFKLEAGQGISYPATTLHRVASISRGHRIAAVTWVQSFVRDAAQREILFDLMSAQRSIFKKDGKSREFDLLAKTYANLLRRWSEN